jgi:hypothetical protein
VFSIITILWNILFNLGFLYTNGIFIYDFWYPANPLKTADWNSLGLNLGEIVMRFFYSSYVKNNYFPF